MDIDAIQKAMQTSLMAYCCGMTPAYDPAPHHRHIAKVLEDVAAGKKSRVIIQAPPRHGKSELVSKHFPAWFMGNHPSRKIITASHTATLAEDFGGQVRDLILDPLHVATFGNASALDPRTTARGDFKTVSKGTYFAVGVGGTPIGKGADVVLIDDPIKSRDEAESATFRQKLKNWYTSSIYTRLEGQGAVILMHQRWHNDDLAGWLLEEHADEDWEVVDLPALAIDDNDVMGRVEGEALWWQRYDEVKLNKIRTAIGQRDWQSMYQGRPNSVSGDEFKKGYLRYYQRPSIEVGRGLVRYILVDPASSKKKDSDFTAMAVVGLGADGNNYLLDGIRRRMKLSERAAALFELHRKWSPQHVGYESYGQQADIEHIQSVMELENYRFMIEPLGGRMRKVERIRRILPDLENSRWWFPEEIMTRDQHGKSFDLMETIVDDEMLPFPVASHDDFIDAVSRVYDMTMIRPRSGMNNKTGVSTGGPRPW